MENLSLYFIFDEIDAQKKQKAKLSLWLEALKYISDNKLYKDTKYTGFMSIIRIKMKESLSAGMDWKILNHYYRKFFKKSLKH